MKNNENRDPKIAFRQLMLDNYARELSARIKRGLAERKKHLAALGIAYVRASTLKKGKKTAVKEQQKVVHKYSHKQSTGMELKSDMASGNT